jgi:hypothetical protein
MCEWERGERRRDRKFQITNYKLPSPENNRKLRMEGRWK